MRPEEQLGAILDETTVALARFDLDGLLELLQRAETLRIAGCEAVTGGPGRVAAKHELLGAMLRSTESNLSLLQRLHGGEAVGRWER